MARHALEAGIDIRGREGASTLHPRSVWASNNTNLPHQPHRGGFQLWAVTGCARSPHTARFVFGTRSTEVAGERGPNWQARREPGSRFGNAGVPSIHQPGRPHAGEQDQPFAKPAAACPVEYSL